MATNFPGSSFVSERGSGILLSRVRLSSVDISSTQFEKKPNAPPAWPAVLTSFLHSASLGAALMTWLDVCKEVVGPDHEDVKVVAQTYYGRLLAVNGICELVTSQYVGVVSDKHGRRPVQVAAQLGQVVDYLLAALCLPSMGLIGQLKGSAWFVLFFSRGIAGLMGNYKVSLQSYTADISSVEDCPTRMAYLGGGIVTGMCAGSLLATGIKISKISFRASFLAATCINVGIIFLVYFKWRDIAPRKDYTWREVNPFASCHLLTTNRAMAPWQDEIAMPQVFVIMILFGMGAITYPLSVSLATRELPPELQGGLQGAVIIPATSRPGQFYGMVYLVAGLLLLPSFWPCHELYKCTGRLDPDRTVMLEEIGG
eukprot:Skav203310  [mRNA]  locus=scaffold1007:8835:14404:- [translate_table: standard]